MADPVLLIGGQGNIGQRYQAILRHLEIPFLVHDIDAERDLHEIAFEKAIICTPTPTHMEYVHLLMKMDKMFLCEKPLTMDPMDEVKPYKRGFVVCNYKFVAHNHGPVVSVFYDYYKTGNDGVLWDCCQLIYLDPDCEICTTSPIWTLAINGRPQPYRNLELSYVQMIKSFCWNNGKELWSLEDGMKMRDAVLDWMEREKK